MMWILIRWCFDGPHGRVLSQLCNGCEAGFAEPRDFLLLPQVSRKTVPREWFVSCDMTRCQPTSHLTTEEHPEGPELPRTQRTAVAVPLAL